MLFGRNRKSPPAVPDDAGVPAASKPSGLTLFSAKRPPARDASVQPSDVVTDGSRRGLVLRPLKDVSSEEAPTRLGLFLPKPPAPQQTAGSGAEEAKEKRRLSKKDSAEANPDAVAAARNGASGAMEQAKVPPAATTPQATSAVGAGDKSAATATPLLSVFQRFSKGGRASTVEPTSPAPETHHAPAASSALPPDSAGRSTADRDQAGAPTAAPIGGKAASGVDTSEMPPMQHRRRPGAVRMALLVALAASAASSWWAYRGWTAWVAAAGREQTAVQARDARQREVHELLLRAAPVLARDSSIDVKAAMELARQAWLEGTTVSLTHRIDDGFAVLELTVQRQPGDRAPDTGTAARPEPLPGCQLQPPMNPGTPNEPVARHVCKTQLRGVHLHRTR